MRTLCIDVGATRIKASVIDSEYQIPELNQQSLFAMRSLGWLNKNLEKILSDDNWAGLNSNPLLTGYDDVAIGICTEVGKDGEIMGHKASLGVSKDLQKRLSRSIGNKPVRIINDAEAWLNGAIRYSEKCQQPIRYPCLALTLGTGVGYAWAKSRGKIKPSEFGGVMFNWSSLRKSAGYSNVTPHVGVVHEIMGKSFFNWVVNENPDWSYFKIREEYTNRFIALVKDIADERKKQPLTIFIGGGNAEYISVRTAKAKLLFADIVCFRSPGTIINPDYIPLLGLLKNKNQSASQT